MSNKTTRVRHLDNNSKILYEELLNACKGQIFEVHHGPPSFWNSELDEKLELYFQLLPKKIFSTCPICHHELKGTMNPEGFHDPWWIYPQKAFSQSEVCSHFEAITFSILWTRNEPNGAPWLIPCGWGVPAISESLLENENLVMSVKAESIIENGSTIFWTTYYREQPGIPLYSDFWPLPILRSRQHIKPSPNSRGFWGEFSPLNIHNSLVWSKLFLNSPDGKQINYETFKDTGEWAQKIKSWSQSAYNQPLKLFEDKLVSESGLASFAIGMKSSRTKGALFITQLPLFNLLPPVLKTINHNIVDKNIQHQVYSQHYSIEQLKELSETDTLWALFDPFQNESIQDWLRIIKKDPDIEYRALWEDSSYGQSWFLTADSTHSETLRDINLVEFYRSLSPVIVKLTPHLLERSYQYNLGAQSWGAFFISSKSIDQIHFFLRKHLLCYQQGHWAYFRFYETQFLIKALASLKNLDLKYFFGPIEAWIFRNKNETTHILFTLSYDKYFRDEEDDDPYSFTLPSGIYEIAQKVYQFDLPRRIKDFIRERTPEFSNIVSETIMNRWIRSSVREGQSWGIKKEQHLIKFFLWKVLITPTWSQLKPFQKLLEQNVAEEVKIQNIETLFPQLRLNEIPRGLSIEAWDGELWNELRNIQSALGFADPESFHPMLGEKPPTMPLQNPTWLKTLGLFYESAYADLFAQSGVQLLDSAFDTDLNCPSHPPPRIFSLTSNEIIIRDEGSRSHIWLKKHGFELMASTHGNWIFHCAEAKTRQFLLREFLEEFPYIESKYLFELLNPEEKRNLLLGLEIYFLHWDSHHFWNLFPYKFKA